MLAPMKDQDLRSMITPPPSGMRGPMMHIAQLDWILRGIQPGKLVVLGGYVGSYKTLLGINMMYKNAINLKYNVMFLSLEMYEKEIYQRLIVRHANSPIFEKYSKSVTMHALRNGELKTDEMEFLCDIVIPDLQTSKDYGNIMVVDNMAFDGNILGLADYVEKTWVSTYGQGQTLDLLIIDYIQLLAQYWGDGSDPTNATKKVASYLKRMAMGFNDHGMVVVALSQLSRAAYMAAKDVVKFSRERDPYQYLYSVTSFAESAEIERASDVALTLFVDDTLKNEHAAFLQLIKNRDGESIEKGIKIRTSPDLAYIGDYVEDTGFSIDDYIGELLGNVARL